MVCIYVIVLTRMAEENFNSVALKLNQNQAGITKKQSFYRYIWVGQALNFIKKLKQPI